MSDPHVFHFVLTRSPDGRDVERLATLCLEPAEYHRLGAAAVLAAVEADRRRWQRAAVAQYGPGWAVRVTRERGYVRSLYPGAAVPLAPTAAGRGVPGQVGRQ